MILKDLLLKLNINDFDCKDHEFIFKNKICHGCYNGASKEQIDNLSDRLRKYVEAITECTHDYYNNFLCNKCNILLTVYEHLPGIYIIENHTDNLDSGQEICIEIDSDKYLSCSEFTIKRIIT